jgi:hypothetical protein
MKIPAFFIGMVLLLVIGSAPRLSAQEADASFKKAVAESYKCWLHGSAFICAYEGTLQWKQGNDATTDIHLEFRYSTDPASKRYVLEQHAWPSPATNNMEIFYFFRWDGKEAIFTQDPRLRRMKAPAPQPTRLTDVPLGTPLCTSVMVVDTNPGFSANNLMDEITGFSLAGKPTEERLAAILQDPKARLQHVAGSPEEELTLSLEKLSVVFDARLGLIKAATDEGETHIERRVTRFVERLPAEVKLHCTQESHFMPAGDAEFRAIEGQCHSISREDFEKLVHLPVPEEMLVPVRNGGLIIRGGG